MKVISKAKQVLNSVPKRLAAIFGVVAAVMVPLAIYAWGPSRTTFTMEKPATYVTFNSITNNPNHGDERNFLSVRDTDKGEWDPANKNGWTDIINLQEGHTYEIQMYVHNNASANLGLVATNVRAHMNLPVMDSTYGKQFQVNAFLWSDNAKPTEIWDNIVLKSDRAFHTKVVAAKYTTNKGVFDLNQDELFGSSGQGTGALLGYDKMDGNIPGCMQYAGYITIKFEPVFQVVPAPAYDVEKTVDKTTAKPGDTIKYTINVKNTGNVNLTNVKVTDQLPAYYSKAEEKVSSQNGSTGSIVKGGQITFNKLNVGETATIEISYTIKSADDLECGDTVITNKVTGTTDQDQTEDDNNNNQVTTTVTKECVEEKPGYDISKSVDKTTAKPGDTIKYTIVAKNTGNVDLTNVKITDKLPAYYSNATEQINAPSTTTGSIVKDGQLTISKLPVGSTATITISYQIKAEADLKCGDTVITNKVTGTTDQDQTEDNNNNNQVTTTVNRDCTPGYDISKSVDKTTAKPGDTIKYTITVKNTGKADLTNVKVTDKLPAYYSEAVEEVDAQGTVTGSIIRDGAVTISKLPVGSTATITINYTIKSGVDLDCGDTVITNKVSGTTDQDQTEDSNDNNQVTTTVANDCEYGYDLVKTVDKPNAQVGDTLTYTLTFKNTGRLDVTNVVIKDALPQGVALTGDIETQPETKVSGDITGDGLVIDKVKAGEEVQIILTAKITATNDDLQCGDNELTNTASATTNEDQTENNNDNNSATTVVTRECTPVVPPETPDEPENPETPKTPETPETPEQPQTPTVIAQTGVADVLGTVLGLGAIAAAVTAYIRSRKYAINK